MPYPMPNSTFAPGSLLDNYPHEHLLLPNPKRSVNPNSSSHRRTLSSIDTQAGASRTSSLQKVWAEDYYNIDYSSEGEYTDQGVRETVGGHLPPASQPCPGSFPFEQENEPSPARPSRTHQRSLTALLSFRSPTRTSSKSPERKSPQQTPGEELDFMPTLTGDKEGVIKMADRSKGLASWFTGSSAPVQMGIPVSEEEPSTVDTSPERGKLQKRPTLPTLESSSSTNTTPVKNTSAAARVANFFSSPKTPSRPTAVQLPADLNHDEFLTLDIKAALFPSGVPSEQDPFSPAAFKNLLQNAEGILSRLQNAYKLRTLSLHELSAEKEALVEELEEAQTRTNLLKTSISDMGQQASEKDTTITELMTALTAEKQARADEKEARERSIAMVKARAQRDAAKRGSTSDLSISTTGEDLGFSSPKWKRQSGGTDFMEPDSDTESGAGESTFSRARSPVQSIAGTTDSTPAMTPEIIQASFGKMVPNPYRTSGFEKRPKMVQQKSTFQKVLGRISTAQETVVGPEERDPYGRIGMGDDGCSNCRGQTSSVAWDTVGLMRAENKGLKHRVADLEKAVDEASDLCDGFGLR
ncbi:hypothetical protein EG329_005853 [Mollisiaceae sp. DMI_Dod_QoI]|nr:hypothetical protein EG329_005853 [Helotiales sp. DMI_Dod_QoI]